MRRCLAFVLAVLVLALVAPRAAKACAVVTARGVYASVAEERAVVVSDGREEHLVRQLTFDGDASDIGCIVVTPQAPDVARLDAAPFDALDRTGPPADAGARGDAPESITLDGFEHVTLSFDGAPGDAGGDVLGDWLRAQGYEDRSALRAWVGSYAKKGWAVTALRFHGERAAGRTLAKTALVRLSLSIDAPFYPYTEPERDIEAQAAFLHRYHATATARDASVWVVAPTEVSATGNFLQGLPEERAWRASADKVAAALGDTTAWRFDPRQRPTWNVTHLHETLDQRVAFEDLRFAPREEDAAATSRPAPRRDRTTAIFFLLLALGLGTVVVVSVARLSS